MKIVLRADVEHVGKKGDLCVVADGYARNYLVPRGLAIQATKGVIGQAEAMRRNRGARDTREREAAELVAGRLNGARVTVTARAGEGGKLFGSVTASDVATALSVIALTDVDRRSVTIAEAIKELGEFEVSVRLHEGVIAKATVEVVSE
ncbi:MAG: 50S ribosomal protein L9 [Actinobacteria bacterium]|uniref:50S ribosomal protein L9 n=1 Tax=freshwater metagenome TaxID=449393 RepID=A0A6J7N5S5_9ZZZZ|nr:50S ribosomal protein L9 [Actinomycetota bacterium]MSW06062.1 50S ribosomal protein L9 [Actinomycetota bacterium]MSX81355.1 50S ribosomal protein L9 [Actinomycetota bacterium]MSY06088.1 50S ribosomal protein L9 [Actinomycetota bacterium]